MATLTPQNSVVHVEDLLDVLVQLVALGQHVVEIVLAQHPAQRGLRQLAGRREVADLDHRALGIHHAEINDGVHLHRDVVAGDHVLGRHLVHHDAQIDAHHLLNERHQQEEPRALGAGVAAEREDDPALVLAQDARPDQRGSRTKTAMTMIGAKHHGFAPSSQVRLWRPTERARRGRRP